MATSIIPATTNQIMKGSPMPESAKLYKPCYDPYNPTPEEGMKDYDDLCKAYDKYNLSYTDYGIRRIRDTYYDRKGGLIDLLSRHPNWDPKNKLIRLDVKLSLKPDTANIYRFCHWVGSYLFQKLQDLRVYAPNQMTPEQGQGYLYDPSAIRGQLNRADYIDDDAERRDRVHYLYGLKSWYDDPEHGVEWVNNAYYNFIPNFNLYVSQETKTEYEKYVSVLKIFSEYRTATCDKETADILNGYTEKYEDGTVTEVEGLMPELKAVEGKRFTKIVRQFCVIIGADKVKEEKEIIRHGQTVVKDYGYNYMISLYGDAINPIVIQRPTFISINEIDYALMSNGYNWLSCHSWSTEYDYGTRGVYSSGPLSYMLDSVSFVFYNLKSSDTNPTSASDYEEPYWEPKFNRCVFQYYKGKLVQGRVYPSENDSENGIYQEVRAIVQKVIAECLGADNYWHVKKGSSNITSYVNSYGTHYRDYECGYGHQHSISFLKSVYDSEIEDDKAYLKDKMAIGHNPICANCGDEHDNERDPLCQNCADSYEYRCYECGCGIHEDDDDRVSTTDGRVFCCENCAHSAGYYEVKTFSRWSGTWDWDGEYRSEDDYDVYRDEYTGHYFYDPDGRRIETEDGNCYMTDENAEADGYIFTEEEGWQPENECCITNRGLWYLKSSCEYCDECDEWVVEFEYDYDHKMCDKCYSERVDINREEVMNKYVLVSIA